MAEWIFTAVTATAALVIACLFVKRWTSQRPFVNIDLDARSWPCRDGTFLVWASATLHNASPRTARVAGIDWECRAVSAYTDREIERKPAHAGNGDFAWELLESRTVEGMNLSVAPGQTVQETVNFFVPAQNPHVRVKAIVRYGGRRGGTKSAAIFHDAQTPAPPR